MKLLKLYSWITGTMADFAKPFSENKALYNQAKEFWNKLENNSLLIVLIFLVLGFAWAAYYYTSYNNSPGRHYTPKHWILLLLTTVIVTFLVTLGFEYLAVEPKINGAFLLEVKIAIANALYAAFIYLLTSIVWCNTLSTNAYKMFKF
jgi:membrane-associated HD superfamily phosphohydrolase